ncbi:MAG: DUF488 family protein [Methanoregulaceae archaeon]
MIQVKCVYDPPQAEDGFRVLVERLWPRGMTREMAHLDLWLKEIAPGTSLRKWFAHDPAKWEAFANRYEKELSEKTRLGQIPCREEPHDPDYPPVFRARCTA